MIELKEMNYQIVIDSQEYYTSIKNTVLEYEDTKEIIPVSKIIEIMQLISKVYELSEPFLYKEYLSENMN